MQLPASVRELLLLEIYRQANDLDWDFLSNGERTAQYRKWIEDPKVGGVLLAHGPEKDARVWIKDVPMKEYGRSQEGIGHYVRYAVNRFRGPEEVVLAAFGDGWSVEPGSVGEKPNHCRATNGEVTRYVCWGRPSTFRDLIWAALNEAIGAEQRPAIVVATRDGESIPTVERLRQIAVADHCAVNITHLHRTMIQNPDYAGASLGS